MPKRLDTIEALHKLLREDVNVVEVARLGDYKLFQDLEPATSTDGDYFLYYIEDEYGNEVGDPWLSKEDAHNFIGTTGLVKCQPVKDFYKYVTETRTPYVPTITKFNKNNNKKKANKNKRNNWGYQKHTDGYDIYDVDVYGDDNIDVDNKWHYTPYTPSYKTSTEEALKKYCNSNTLCFHKTDPTTTMLEQIYAGKGWDVITDANEMSSDTISALIDAHERIVMLGHGSGYGLFGFINPIHASHLKNKKLFALWCNADAYCDKYLKGKTGFFACGNMPSDDSEARFVGYNVSHKYMDDNITYWCKLCGDVVEQCLEGDADAGCKYIRDKYWERYHKGTADEVGITKYNYVRTKVAGQANLPEPSGEEIISTPSDTNKNKLK